MTPKLLSKPTTIGPSTYFAIACKLFCHVGNGAEQQDRHLALPIPRGLPRRCYWGLFTPNFHRVSAKKSCKKHSSYSYFHVAWQHSATRTLRFLSTSFYSLAHCLIWLFGYSLPTPRQVTSLTEIGFFLTEASITHTECLVHYLPQRSAPNVLPRS